MSYIGGCLPRGVGGRHSVSMVLPSKSLRVLSQPPAPAGVSFVPGLGSPRILLILAGAFPEGRGPLRGTVLEGQEPSESKHIRCLDACVGVSGAGGRGFCRVFICSVCFFENCASDYTICLRNMGLVPTGSFY